MQVPLLILAPRGTRKPRLFNKLFTTWTAPPPRATCLISHYFSLLHSSPDLTHLRHLHARLLRTSLYDNVVLSSKLVLMYSHHNRLTPHSLSTFFHMPCKNIYSWNIIIACGHGGLVEQARSYFKMMQNYGLVAELRHYATIVDCLARAGRFEEAEKFISDIPMEPDEAVLGAILAGCRVHNNVEVGERIAKRLIRLKPEKAGYYVLLANMYAGVGRFHEAEMVRDSMQEKNMSKVFRRLRSTFEDLVDSSPLFTELSIGVVYGKLCVKSFIFLPNQANWHLIKVRVEMFVHQELRMEPVILQLDPKFLRKAICHP
ncbi:pentatricopeptide repeat-containing protein At1g20230 isoform X2 [Ricinus communis]|uniref:pentatricopeptide repeat-containing protein At1g20230 isoform X2 n=1 Tax=Ricinus communis TaxID=3988 RepID=UPI00201A3818|nr:pentatricopeptide repeat-containing protein At1g20230 isoform X2 [Ricinus communis]